MRELQSKIQGKAEDFEANTKQNTHKSFEVNALMENMSTLMSEVSKNRPSGVKGQFVKSIVLATTMGPGIPVDVTAALSLAVD